MARIIDLSHTIQENMPSFPGLPSPVIGAILDHQASRPHYNNEAEFYLGRIEMACNTGTYLDAPFHRHRQGRDVSKVVLTEVTALPGLVIDALSRAEAINYQAELEDLSGKAVLIRTGWDAKWGQPGYFEESPFLSAGFVEALVQAGAALVGVDFANVDSMKIPARPVHTDLLAKGVMIIENLTNLAELPRSGFQFHAAPLKIKGAASIPIRAYAVLT